MQTDLIVVVIMHDMFFVLFLLMSSNFKSVIRLFLLFELKSKILLYHKCSVRVKLHVLLLCVLSQSVIHYYVQFCHYRFSLMTHCWQLTPTDRPSFSHIHFVLSGIIEEENDTNYIHVQEKEFNSNNL